MIFTEKHLLLLLSLWILVPCCCLQEWTRNRRNTAFIIHGHRPSSLKGQQQNHQQQQQRRPSLLVSKQKKSYYSRYAVKHLKDNDDDDVDVDDNKCNTNDDASPNNQPAVIWKNHNLDDDKKSDSRLMRSRRSVVQSMLLLLLSGTTGILGSSTIPYPANAEQPMVVETDEEDEEDVKKYLDCLMDLPSLPSDNNNNWVRIYLCRHGQTENNRLHLVQGARVDPPLNDTGIRMANRIGQALSRLPPPSSSSSNNNNNHNNKNQQLVGVHSSLLRAKQTAQYASNSYGQATTQQHNHHNDQQQLFVEDAMTAGATATIHHHNNNNNDGYPILGAIPELGEVDFGSGNEGKPAVEARADMYATFAAWSIGKIDTRPSGGGETAREVLTRASKGLYRLADIASSNGGSVVAVSHSTYLRMLLTMVMNVPLSQAPLLEQKNGCINVLDIELNSQINIDSSKLFGGSLLAPSSDDFSITIPNINIVRINENRHLTGLL